MIAASMPNAVRVLVITSLAAALGHPGEVRSSIRIPVTPSPQTTASRGCFDVAKDGAVPLGAGLITGVDQPGQRIAHADRSAMRCCKSAILALAIVLASSHDAGPPHAKCNNSSMSLRVNPSCWARLTKRTTRTEAAV